jgi:uncharacterized protein (DUF697 family)
VPSFKGLRPLVSAAREAQGEAAEQRPLALGGARELVPLLAKALRAGGEAGAVVEHWVPDAAALGWIGPPDEAELRRAARAGVPIVGVSQGEALPYVLDTALVVVGRGEGLPVEGVARALARSLGPRAAGLAARLPVLRVAVVEQLVEASARRNAVLASGILAGGADLPVLLAHQVRLVVRVALASGQRLGPERLGELAGVLAAGYGARRLARRLGDALPLPGFAVRGAIAYAATRAIGEAARARFAAAPSDRGPTLQPVAERGGPPDDDAIDP